MGVLLVDKNGRCFPSHVSGTRTLVLMGRTGNGKSATGNTILGNKAFVSRRSSSGVTDSADCQKATFENGAVVNVIDTPGLFDFTVGIETVSKEIVKCIELAKDGVDAVLLVFSVGRFTKEEASAFESVRAFFGPKIIEYIILVFTGGDNLDEGQSLNSFLEVGSDRLKDILKHCENRVVLFDNKTVDQGKKASQLQKLFSLVDAVLEKNNGQRYSDEWFKEMREVATRKIQLEKEVKGHSKQEQDELLKEIKISCDERIKELTEKVEGMMKEIQELQEELRKERAKAKEKQGKERAKAKEKQGGKAEEKQGKERAKAEEKQGGSWWCVIM